MDKIACLYFEGNDSKVALLEYEGGKLTLLKAESIDTSLAFAEQDIGVGGKGSGSAQKEIYSFNVVVDETSTMNKTLLGKLNEFFRSVDLSKCRFIPILTEPAIYFQKVNDTKDFTSSHAGGNGRLSTVVDFCELSDHSKLAVYPSGKSSYLQVMDSLARMNSRRVLRIPSVKSAEISLASYVAGKRTFSDDESSLVLYVGKEYSKLTFLRGGALSQIGSTLSVGKNSFDAHNVIVRKILLEMEHAALGNISNIIICGEDTSNELVSAISETYPRSNVIVQHVESVETKDTISNIDSFIVPVAVAEEYIAELDKKLTGINLLPQYVRDEQKVVQLGWQGYVMVGLIFLSTAFFSIRISSHSALLETKNIEATRIKNILEQNREILNRIRSYEARIQNVDKTKAVLNQLSSGTGIVSAQLKKLSLFTGNNGNLWISQIAMDQSKHLKLGGYSLSRLAVKELSDSYENSLLQNITYDPLKNSRTFKFSVEQAGVSNEKKK